MNFFSSILLLLSSFSILVYADISVTVGPDLAFHPNVVYGNPGELINFNFANSGFSASEATARLEDPCNTEGGFDSGNQQKGSTFTIVISTHNSIYVFSQNQCHLGMVMIVNPGSNDSVQKYASVASNGNIQTASGSGSSGGESGSESNKPTSTSTSSTPSSTNSKSTMTTATSQAALTSSNNTSSTSFSSPSSTISSMTNSITTSAPLSQTNVAKKNLISKDAWFLLMASVLFYYIF